MADDPTEVFARGFSLYWLLGYQLADPDTAHCVHVLQNNASSTLESTWTEIPQG